MARHLNISRPKAEDEVNIFFDIIRQWGGDSTMCYRLIHFTFVIYTTNILYKETMEISGMQTMLLYETNDDHTLFVITGNLREYIDFVADMSCMNDENRELANDLFKSFNKLKLGHVWKGFKVKEIKGKLKWVRP